MRYSRLPRRFLRNQPPATRAFFRGAAAQGRLYYRPGPAPLAGLLVLEPGEAVPAGWLQVTVTA